MEQQRLLGKAIRAYRRHKGLTQGQLAEAAAAQSPAAEKLDQTAISRIEQGKQGISPEQQAAIAAALGCHVSELWQMVEQSVDHIGEERAQYVVPAAALSTRAIPLISWVQAGHWADVENPFAPGVCEELLGTHLKASRRAFALEVKGESMTNPRGWPSFPPGVRIIVDPKVEPVNGSLVVVTIEGETESTFKKLVMDGGRRYLQPLNPQFPIIPVDRPMRIQGVVVGMAESTFT